MAVSVRVTMMGSGTSTGVPVIGCTCPVCTSANPRNRRLRPGLKLEIGDRVVLVDTPPDLREQALRFGLPRVDAVVFTHPHADHIFGLDDVRIFNFRQQAPIPCYGSAETLRALRRVFAYVFEEGQAGGGKPQLELITVDRRFPLCGIEVVPIPVWHGEIEVYGYRFGDFAYVTDCNAIPERSFELLAGVRTLVLDALRYRPHSTHFSVHEALEAAARIGAERTVLTHIAHEIDHDAPAEPLPRGVEFGYDGLVLAAGSGG
jgi:phosphoribosyl 1,2-cyclic phosphate phosphodiesterase